MKRRRDDVARSRVPRDPLIDEAADAVTGMDLPQGGPTEATIGLLASADVGLHVGGPPPWVVGGDGIIDLGDGVLVIRGGLAGARSATARTR